MTFYDCYLYAYTMVVAGGTIDGNLVRTWDTEGRAAAALGAHDGAGDKGSNKHGPRPLWLVDDEVKKMTRANGSQPT